ncbi:MAG: hypothetical protein AABX10_05005 [Nanoarchaeota archaeon]
MGKNRDIKSLIRSLVSIVVHEIVARHTNRPESKLFLKKEAVEYRAQAEKASDLHNWNEQDKINIREKVIKEVKRRMILKYPDVFFDEEEISSIIDDEIKKLGFD